MQGWAWYPPPNVWIIEGLAHLTRSSFKILKIFLVLYIMSGIDCGGLEGIIPPQMTGHLNTLPLYFQLQMALHLNRWMTVLLSITVWLVIQLLTNILVFQHILNAAYLTFYCWQQQWVCPLFSSCSFYSAPKPTTDQGCCVVLSCGSENWGSKYLTDSSKHTDKGLEIQGVTNSTVLLLSFYLVWKYTLVLVLMYCLPRTGTEFCVALGWMGLGCRIGGVVNLAVRVVKYWQCLAGKTSPSTALFFHVVS